MGIISHYQRKQLASQAVGVAPMDKSGEILAQGFSQFAAGVTKFASNLQERQNTLDKLSATKTFYDFAQKDAVANAQLQIDYQDNPKEFIPAYEKQSSALSQEVGSNLDGNSKLLFDEMVSKYKAKKSIKDGEWIFNQQNRNALNEASEIGTGFANNAMTLANSKEYMGLVDAFEMTAETSVKPVVSPKGYKTYKKTIQKNMALSYLGGQKTTDPVRLEMELKKDSPFTKQLRKVLGEKGFRSQVNEVQKFRRQFVSDLGFETIVNGKKAAVEYLNQMMVNPSAFSFAEAEKMYTISVNQLNKMREDNKVDGRFTEAIPAQEKNVKAFEYLKNIAANLGDKDIASDGGAVRELVDEIKAIQDDFKGSHKDLSSVKKEARGIKILGVSDREFIGGRFVKTKNGKVANKHYSNYVEKLYEVQLKAFKLRAERKINNSDFDNIINKMITPLSEAEEFTHMTNGGGVGFDKAWNSFEEFAKNIYGEGEDKTFARTEMLKNYMLAVNDVLETGNKPDPEYINLTIELQKQQLARALNPKYATTKVGDTVTVGGRKVKFMGFDSTTGEPVGQLPDGLKVELDNL